MAKRINIYSYMATKTKKSHKPTKTEESDSVNSNSNSAKAKKVTQKPKITPLTKHKDVVDRIIHEQRINQGIPESEMPSLKLIGDEIERQLGLRYYPASISMYLKRKMEEESRASNTSMGLQDNDKDSYANLKKEYSNLKKEYAGTSLKLSMRDPEIIDNALSKTNNLMNIVYADIIKVPRNKLIEKKEQVKMFAELSSRVESIVKTKKMLGETKESTSTINHEDLINETLSQLDRERKLHEQTEDDSQSEPSHSNQISSFELQAENQKLN